MTVISDFWWMCPKCNSTRLDVEVQTSALLKQSIHKSQNEPFTLIECQESCKEDHYWDDNSRMICRACNFAAKSQKFKTLKKPEVVV